ncbi:MAG: Sorbitol operon transcription regulator [Massilibacillus sp.]|jgi:DNA-binding transcriptional regulator LsrR (DeoR family)|nr:Sorbitol operon transcription regulator [Massilibacillus sp.]
MKKIIDDTRLIYKCCSLYYEDEMSQQGICDYLGISRPSVSRMLKLGKDQGIVKIEVVSPYNFTFGKLERELEKKFSLREVIVVDSSPLETGTERISSNLGEETLNFLSRTLDEGEVVGVSMGMTLQNVIRAKSAIDEPIECTFVPIVGGVGQSRVDIHSNYIASEFSKLFHGECVQFFSPAVFSNVTILEGFLNEKAVRNIFNIYKSVTTVIMGIGITQRGASTLLETGYIDENELDSFVKDGAVGDISLQFFDKNGSTEKFRKFNQRVAGMPIEQLKKVPKRIGIAGGSHRADAVLGAIHGGFVNILITDIDCARLLIDA